MQKLELVAAHDPKSAHRRAEDGHSFLDDDARDTIDGRRLRGASDDLVETLQLVNNVRH
jgi:hypothetical protein